MSAKKVITLIQDDREKKPWTAKYLGPEFKIEIKRMRVGDYTIKGMEKLVRIERKANWEEIAVNIGGAKNRGNFTKELLALQQFPIRFLVINADYSSLASMRRYSNAVTPVVIANWMLKIELEFGISVITIGSRTNESTRHMTQEFFKRIANHNTTKSFFYHKIKV